MRTVSPIKLLKDDTAGACSATVDIEQALRETEVCFVAVATPSRPNGQIDPAHLFRACNQIAMALSKVCNKQVVVIRSSILPSIFDDCRRIFESIAPDWWSCVLIRNS